MTHPARLGRLPSPPDPRDHPLSRYVPALGEVERERPAAFIPYRRGLPVYDQVGPSCVGNGSALSATIDQRHDHHRTLVYDGEDLYDRCKTLDGIPHIDGTYPRIAHQLRLDDGILVRGHTTPSGSRDVGQLDRIGAYAALTSVEEIVDAIWLYGSAGLGSTWFAEWDTVDDPGAALHAGVTASGGHYYVAVGYDLRGRTRTPSLLIQNSWGPAWGRKIAAAFGRAWLPVSLIDFADFEAWRSIDLEDD